MITISKIRNWFIPFLLGIGGVLDFCLEGLPHIASIIDIDPEYGKIGTVIAFLVALVISKLQSPSTNPEKLEELVEKAKEKKQQQLLNNS